MVLATSVKAKETKGVKEDQAYCERLANQVTDVSQLPAACRQYDSIVQKVQEINAAEDPFAGMWAGSAAKARAARAQGREHHAQIQRRITTRAATRRFSKLDK